MPLHHYAPFLLPDERTERMGDEHLNKRKIEYYAYLKSDEWKIFRRIVLRIAGNKCTICAEPTNLNIHHKSYENLGNETLEDVVVLCGHCHKLYHKVLPTVEPVNIDYGLSSAINGFLGFPMFESNKDVQTRLYRFACIEKHLETFKE